MLAVITSWSYYCLLHNLPRCLKFQNKIKEILYSFFFLSIPVNYSVWYVVYSTVLLQHIVYWKLYDSCHSKNSKTNSASFTFVIFKLYKKISFLHVLCLLHHHTCQVLMVCSPGHVHFTGMHFTGIHFTGMHFSMWTAAATLHRIL